MHFRDSGPRLGTRLRGYARTIDRERIDHIHEQLAAIRRQGIQAFGSGTHRFTLNPPISLQELEAFEASHGVRLPEEYRAFLLHVGNGGAGQGYGLAPLENTDMGGVLQNPSPLHPDMPQEGNWHEVLGLDEDSDALYDGVLKLLTQGCSYDVLLMVTGPYRGRVVYVDWSMCQAPHFSHFPDFLTWYETWLDETLAGYDMTWFGYGLPLNPRESVAVATDLQEPARRRVAAVNNLLRVPGLDTDLLSVLTGALPAEPDIDVAAGVLMVLATNGVKELAGIGWTLLERAQGGQLVQVIQAMKQAGLPGWTDASLWVLERDADPVSGDGVLSMLRYEKVLSRRAVELALASRHAVASGLSMNQALADPLPVPEAFFTHPDPGVRINAVVHQSKETLRPHLPLLFKLFRQEADEVVRDRWAVQFAQFEDAFMTAELTSLLAWETNPEVLSALVATLGLRGATEAVPLLIALTRHEDGVLRLQAATALGRIGDERARPALEALLDQHEHPGRYSADGGMSYGHSIAHAARKALLGLDVVRLPGTLLSRLKKARGKD